ncbi:hypothetical protein NG831_00080 [Xanthomonas sacchari]|uniref:hypothetical protein n=1 Tax=Xanthomonas sacchari TaxID=56458 RepID=UPI002258A421|nr:hypothetical protein [Xanthomonas sacchari]UYK66673.1 hypothetical protein NG831_00080 [Xanthomonas sacchari]
MAVLIGIGYAAAVSADATAPTAALNLSGHAGSVARLRPLPTAAQQIDVPRRAGGVPLFGDDAAIRRTGASSRAPANAVALASLGCRERLLSRTRSAAQGRRADGCQRARQQTHAIRAVAAVPGRHRLRRNLRVTH